MNDQGVLSGSKVSVILPFFNAVSTLKRAIESVAGQSFENFECLLIDNNSDDGSREIAKHYADTDRRFILISEPNQGVAYASNAGASHARGMYVARMDADDWSYPDRLLKQSEFLDQNPDFAAVGCKVRYMPHSEETAGFARYVEWVNSVLSYDEIVSNQFIELPVVNPTAMWRREIGEECGLYRQGDFPEDYEMWLRWLSEGLKVSKLDEVLLDWYDSENRLTRTKTEYSVASFYRIKSEYLAKWLSKNNPQHPSVAVWGASRISRRRARLIEQHGVNIEYYIDTKRSRRLKKEVIYYEDIPDQGSVFILTYIKQRNARDEIVRFLEARGYAEGVDFLLVS